jgi:hypothetical protein
VCSPCSEACICFIGIFKDRPELAREDEGTGEKCPKELAGMLGSAHPRLVAEPPIADWACIDYWMRLTN